MEKKLIFWTFTFCSVIFIWFLNNQDGDTLYPSRHPQFFNQTTREWIKPRDLIPYKDVLIGLPKTYIQATSAQERLMINIKSWEIGKSAYFDQHYEIHEELKMSGLPVADRALCGQQLDWILKELEQHPNYTVTRGKRAHELTNLLDSFGKIHSGLHSGNTYMLGSYKHCLRSSLDEGRIRGRYCLGHFRFDDWPEKDLVPIRLRIGLCLPETCDTSSADVYKSQIERLARYEMPSRYKSVVKFSSMFCLPDERSPMRKISIYGWTYIIVSISWLIFVTAVSLSYHKSRSNYISNGEKKTGDFRSVDTWIEIIALQNSLKALVDPPLRRIGRVDLSSLCFYKSLMSILIVLGHSFFMILFYSNSVTSHFFNGIAKFSLTLPKFNDSYYVIGGLLMTYNILAKVNERDLSKPSLWIKLNLIVFVKITPVFTIIFLFNQWLIGYLGQGPSWDYGVGASTGWFCRNLNWWMAFPHFANIGNPSLQACNLPGWFITCYVQLALVIPTLTYLIHELPNNLSRYSLVCFILVLSTANTALRVYNQRVMDEYALSFLVNILVGFVDRYEPSGYMETLCRLGPCSIGCLAGYYLHLYKKRKIERWPNWLISRKAMIFIFVGHAVVYTMPTILGNLVEDYEIYPSLGQSAILHSMTSVIWSALNAAAYLSLTTVYRKNLFSDFIDHRFWQSFNNLGLSICLTHMTVLTVSNTAHEHASSVGAIGDVFEGWALGLLAAIPPSLVLFLYIESPIDRALRIVMEQSTKENIEKDKDLVNQGPRVKVYHGS